VGSPGATAPGPSVGPAWGGDEIGEASTVPVGEASADGAAGERGGESQSGLGSEYDGEAIDGLGTMGLARGGLRGSQPTGEMAGLPLARERRWGGRQ